MIGNILQKIKGYITKENRLLVFSFAFLFLFSVATYALAAARGTPYTPGATNDPTDCSPTDTNCFVSPFPDQTGNSGKFLTTDGTTTSWAVVSGGGISSLNGDASSTQTFAVGTAGTDFGISTSSGVHTFNIPSASATARGLVTTGTQTFAGAKTFSANITASSVNNLTITTPTTSATLTIADGKTFTASNTLTFTGTDGTSFAFPGTSDTVMTLGAAQVVSGAKSFDPGALKITGSSSGTVTLNAPSSGGGTLVLPTGNGETIVGRASSDTLTNKTLTSSTNVIGGVTMTLGSDATGDIYYRNASGILTRLPVGGSTTVLHGGTTPSYSAVSLTADVSGILPVANGGTGVSSPLTAGSVVFSNGSALAQDNSNFFWDSTTHRLGIGTNTTTAALTLVGNMDITGSILPTADNTYSLGSATKMWKDVYIGPGSLFVNGQEVVHTDVGDNVNITADPNQSVIVKTFGSGDVELNPSGSGLIAAKGNIQVTGGKYITTSDASNLIVQNGLAVGNMTFASNAITATNLNGGISLTPTGTGGVYVTSGNFGVGDTSPAALLTVGSGDLFQVNSSGAIAAATGITSSGTVTFSGFSTNKGLLYTNGSGVVSQTAQGAANTLLHGNGTGAPTFSAVDLTADVTGILPVANGGTGSSTAPYVTNATNSTLTRSGSGPYTLGINLGNSNTWTGLQTMAISDTATSGSAVGLSITPTYNQTTGTAANTDLLINRTETAVGSGLQYLIDAQVGGTSKFNVDHFGGATTLGGLYLNAGHTSYLTAPSSTSLQITATDNIYFYTAGSESARITDGDFLIGTTTDNGRQFQVAGAASFGGGLMLSAFSTNGGLLYTNGSGVVAQTGAGTANTILHGGTTPSYSAVSLTADITGTLAVGNGGTGATTLTGILIGNGTSAFTATTLSSGIAGQLSDETGSGALVFANTPTLVTPVLGVATATSINKVAITAPATSATLTIADGKTFTASNTLTFTGTDGTSFAFPGSSGTVATLAATQAFTNKTLTSSTNVLGGVTMTLGSDAEGDIYYRNASGVLTRLAIGASNTILHGGTTPSYSAVDLTTDVSGILPVANGGTGASTAPYVTNATDATLTRSGSGPYTLGINLGNANTWTGLITANITNTATSSTAYGFKVTPTYNQTTGTAANTDLLINRTETAVGSGTQSLIDAQVGGTSKFRVDNSGIVYLKGQAALLSDVSSNVTLLADSGNNVIVKSAGTGDIQLNASGSGLIALKSNVQVTGGKTVTTSDASALSFASTGGIAVGNMTLASNAITATNTNGGISLTPTGTGGVYVTSGNFGVGDTSPAALLTVGSGDLFQVNSSGAIAAATGITSSGTVTFSGFSTNGGILYTNGSGVVAQTGAGTSTTILHGGTTPSYSAVSLTADITGTLAVGNGGTGATTLTTKGVLLGNGTSAVSATAAGTDGQILVGVSSGAPAFQTISLSGSGGSLALSNTGVLTFPDAGASTRGLVTTGTQTFAGAKTFNTAGLTVLYTDTATSGSIVGYQITPTYNQASGTAANTDFLVNRTETAVGSGAQLLADFQVGGSSKFKITNGGAFTAAGIPTFSSFSTNGGLLYTNGSGVVAQTGVGTSTTILHGGTSPSYGAVVLTTDVTGILPVANGGTGSSTAPYVTNATDATLTRSGSGPYTLGINLGNANTWTAKQTLQLTTEQLRVGYDASNYYSTTVDSSGGVAFDAVGSGAAFNFSDNVSTTGHIGLGTTSYASWGSGFQTIQGANKINSLYLASSVGNGLAASENAYFNGTTWKYVSTSSAATYGIAAGTHLWRVAGSGTADADITWITAMAIDNSGNVGVGTSTVSAKLHSLSTTEQLRLGYNASTYASFTVSSSGSLTIAPNTSGVSMSIGNGASASSTSSLAVGNSSSATTNATALGVSAIASGGSSVAVGRETTASANFALALGYASTAGNQYAAALTPVSTANFDYSVAIGYAAATTAATQIRLGTSSYNTSIPGTLSIGQSTGTAKLDVISTTEQLRFGYDTSNYLTNTVSSTGVVTLDAVGSNARLVLNDSFGVGTATVSAKANIQSTSEQLRVLYDDNNYYKTTVGSSGGVTFDAVGSGAGFTFSDGLTFSSFSTNGGLLYTNGSGVVAQTGAGTSTTVLHGGTSPSYSAVSLTADVSGILPVANGGTGASTAPYVTNATDATLTRSGSGPYTLGINLGNANTWTAKQTLQLTTEQLRLGYDASNYISHTVSSTGVLAYATTATISTPAFTFNKDISIQSVTAGRGPGGVSTNTALGYQVLNSNTTGYNQVAIGYQTMFNAAGASDDSVAVGYQALYTSNNYGNTAVGSESLKSSTGVLNTAIGYRAGYALGAGNNNVFVGQQTALALTSGGQNVFVGAGAGATYTTANNVAAVGFQALNLSTGTLNNAFGYRAGAVATSGSSNTYLGGFDGTGFETASNRIFLSDGDGNMRVHINNSGDMGIGTSTNTVSARIHAIKTTEQLRLGYDTSNYYSTTVGSTGGVTFDAVGSGSAFTFSDAVTTSSTLNGGYFKVTGRNIIASTGSVASLSGDDNVFMGDLAGNATTTGYRNIFVGASAGRSNTDGYYNTAIGYQSMWNGSTGPTSAGENTAIGYQTLQQGGFDNTAVGIQALKAMTGNFGVAVGQSAALLNTANYTVAIGAQALRSNTTGARNTALGYQAGFASTGDDNFYAGWQTGVNMLGSGNVYLGSQVAGSAGGGTASNNTYVGAFTGYYNGNGSSNSYFGNSAGQNTSTGSYNAYGGVSAGYQTTTGSYNSAWGYLALQGGGTLTGTDNAAFGYAALKQMTSGVGNVGIGSNAGYNIGTTSYNITIGVNAGYSIASNNNIAIGANSMNATTGANNTGIGYGAFGGGSGIGDYNVALGHLAGYKNNGGAYNTLVGYKAGYEFTTGNYNTVLGYFDATSFATTSNNIFIADGANNVRFRIDSSGNAGIGTGTGSISYRLDVRTDDANYAQYIFNDGNNVNRKGLLIQTGVDDHTAASTSTLVAFKDGDGTDVGSITFGSSATAYNTTSDQRLKDNIVDTALSIDVLNQIKIRDYTWKADPEHKLSHGVIAQELYQVYPGAVTVPADDTGYWMVDYSKLTPLLVKAVQDVNLKVELTKSLDVAKDGSLASLIVKFLSDPTNSIKDLYATIVHSDKVQTKELCIEDVCVTKAQLQLLLNQQAGGTSVPQNPAPTGGGQTTGDTGSAPVGDSSGSTSSGDTPTTGDQGSAPAGGDIPGGVSAGSDAGTSSGDSAATPPAGDSAPAGGGDTGV